jgi:hypothetical protein
MDLAGWIVYLLTALFIMQALFIVRLELELPSINTNLVSVLVCFAAVY